MPVCLFNIRISGKIALYVNVGQRFPKPELLLREDFMTVTSFLAGFIVATAGGAFVTTVVIDAIAWCYVQRKLSLEKKKAGSLSLPLGIAERSLYFFAFLVGAPSWIGVWLAIKVAVQWHRWPTGERAIYNIFLIGNALSILSALGGACLALGRLPGFGGQ